jgi:hypothetical protein
MALSASDTLSDSCVLSFDDRYLALFLFARSFVAFSLSLLYNFRCFGLLCSIVCSNYSIKYY